MPGSPLLPLHPSSCSSLTGFRDSSEVSGEDLSLHDNTLVLEDHPVPTKELFSATREDTKRGSHGDSFPVPQFHHRPFSIISELDPGLQHLLGGTVSPAVASTPSPTTNRSLASSPPVEQLHRPLRASEEEVIGVIRGGDGQEESPGATTIGMGGGDDQEDFNEMV